MKDSRIFLENTRIFLKNSRTSSHGQGMFLCHTDITDFTDIFRITKKARLRAFFIEPCSHCQPDARSASKAGRRKARRDNHTNEGAQTWLYHTDNTDFTDIFSNTNDTKKARLRAFSLSLPRRAKRTSSNVSHCQSDARSLQAWRGVKDQCSWRTQQHYQNYRPRARQINSLSLNYLYVLSSMPRNRVRNWEARSMQRSVSILYFSGMVAPEYTSV